MVHGGPAVHLGRHLADQRSTGAESLVEGWRGVSVRRRGVGSLEWADFLVAGAVGGPECNTSCPFPGDEPGRSLTGWDVIEVFDVAAARRALARRLLRCPGCGSPLRPWGRARPRTVRDADGGDLVVRPDRARCTACQATHVVLDAALLAHRAYTVRVIGRALLGAARGQGHRPIAARLAVPEGTVRSWLRRARQSAHRLWTIGVQAVVALDADALPTREQPDTLAYAIEALVAAAVAGRNRLGSPAADLWSQITVLTRGQLLAPAPVG
jgi:hypothetical protein